MVWNLSGQLAQAAELVRAEDYGGVDTPLGVNTVVALTPALTIVAPAGPAPVDLEWDAYAMVTSPGAGCIICGPVETTSGAMSPVQQYGILGGSFTMGTFSAFAGSLKGTWPLGVVASPRVFTLAAVVYPDTGSALTASIRGGTANGARPWLRANQRVAA